MALIAAPAWAEEYHVIATVNIASEPACSPAATRAANGDVLVAFGTNWEPMPPVSILKLTRSSDGGRSWSQPQVLWDPAQGGANVNCSMTALRDGTLLLPCTYHEMPERDGVPPEEKNPYKIYNVWDHRNRKEVHLLTSTDDGKTWDRQVIFKSRPREWLQTFGRIMELANGDILVPAYWGKYNAEQTDNDWRAHGFLRSRDGGKTWRREEMPRPWQSEISPALLADGTLVAIMRHNGDGEWPRRVFGVSRSTNNGRTWSEPVPTGVRGKMPDLLTLASGRVLMGVGAEGLSDGAEVFTTKSRNSFATLFVSDDGCRTWKKDVAFAPADPANTIVPADSPVLVPLDDGRIFVVLQAIDRSKEGDPLMGYSVGMSLIGNVLEPKE